MGFRRIFLGPVAVVAALSLLGVWVARDKWEIVRAQQFTGHADESAYCAMARSLVAGRGLTVDYVSWYFVPYGREISRREDHWPPFLPLTIAPFLMEWGASPGIYKVSPILFGSLALPLAAAWLGYAFSRRGYVAMLAGLLMLASPVMWLESMKVLADVPLAALTAGWCAALISARRRPTFHLLAGALLAMACYAKGNQVMFLAGYPVLAALAGGREGRGAAGGSGGWRVIKTPWPWFGMLVAGLLLTPWWWSNWQAHGNPFFSTQNYVAEYFGLEPWEVRTYQVYWGKDLPKIEDRWRKHPEAYWPKVRANIGAMARWAVLGPAADAGRWSVLGTPGVEVHRLLTGRFVPPEKGRGEGAADLQDEVTAIVGAAGVLFLPGLVVALPIGWGVRRACKRRRFGRVEVAETEVPRDPLLGPVLMLLTVIGVQAGFVIFLWDPEPRFAFMLLPLVAVLGVTAITRVVELPVLLWRPAWARRWEWATTVVLAAAVAAVGYFRFSAFAGYERSLAGDLYPMHDQDEYPTLARWCDKHVPHAVLMLRNPWEFNIHRALGEKCVATPWARPEELFAVARYFHAGYYYADCERPGMDAYVNGDAPGLTHVEGDPTGKLFKIDYSKAPGAEGEKRMEKGERPGPVAG